MAQRKTGAAGSAKKPGAKAATAKTASAKTSSARAAPTKSVVKKSVAKTAASKPAAVKPKAAKSAAVKASKPSARKSAAAKPKASAAKPAPPALGLIESRDPRIDAYIAKSAAFAQPILEHVRNLMHAACPQVEETIKWGMPAFVYRGKMLCGMGAFKQHATLGFWQAPNIADADLSRSGEAMGQFGRITAIGDLPGPRELIRLAKQAMERIEAGATRGSSKSSQPKPPVAAPEDLLAALKRNAKARATYEGFSPSQKRDYVNWIEEAKREETRKSRLAQAVEWMAEGKIRYWKYQTK